MVFVGDGWERDVFLRCFYYKKAARPGKFLHVLLYTRWLVAKISWLQVIYYSQPKSSFKAKIPVQGTIAIFAVNMCTRKHPNKLNPVQQLLHSKMWFETTFCVAFKTITCSHKMFSYNPTGERKR